MSEEVSSSLPILVIGAGIGGLTLALALRRRGLRPLVCEQAPRFGEVGAGLTLAPNAMHVLRALGLGDEIGRLASVPRDGGIAHYATGRLLVRTRRGDEPERRYGAPYCQVHRADLHAVLAAAVLAADPAAIRCGLRLCDIEQQEGRVLARFADGSTVAGSVLVGCDGTRSQTRSLLFGADDVEYTGYTAYRALVPTPVLPGLAGEPDSLITIGPGRSLARYRVGQGRWLNVAAFVETTAWAGEGWSIPATAAELKAHFAGFHPGIQQILRAVPDEGLFRWGLFARRPLPRWSSGRVTLLGDAAHPMLPFLGQGAAMAIEDAWVLAQALAADGPSGVALAGYEARRREHAAEVARHSLEAVRRFHSGSPDHYDQQRHRDAESLGLFASDVTRAAGAAGTPKGPR